MWHYHFRKLLPTSLEAVLVYALSTGELTGRNSFNEVVFIITKEVFSSINCQAKASPKSPASRIGKEMEICSLHGMLSSNP